MQISDYYGRVSQCNACTNHDPDQPTSCNRCFCRGYVAECLACAGKGMTEEPVAGGASGKMKVTCSVCGGKALFAVKKPADWDLLHPPTVEEAQPEPESEPVEEVAQLA